MYINELIIVPLILNSLYLSLIDINFLLKVATLKSRIEYSG